MSLKLQAAEYDAFHKMTEGIRQAEDAAKQMSHLRPDQKFAWEKLAEVWRVAREACYRLASESAKGTGQ